MKTVSYTIRVWHKDTGLSAFVIQLRTNDRQEAWDQFNEHSKRLNSQYGLALQERIDTENEIARTK